MNKFEKAIERAFNNKIISREIIIVNDVEYEKIVLIKNNKEWITYVHQDGIKQTILSDEYLDKILEKT